MFIPSANRTRYLISKLNKSYWTLGMNRRRFVTTTTGLVITIKIFVVWAFLLVYFVFLDLKYVPLGGVELKALFSVIIFVLRQLRIPKKTREEKKFLSTEFSWIFWCWENAKRVCAFTITGFVKIIFEIMFYLQYYSTKYMNIKSERVNTI